MALGKDFVNYAEVLNLCHAAGLKEIDTDLLQIPNAENDHTAIVKATVELEDGTKTAGYGDASPLEEYDKDGNPPRKPGPVTTATIRMAETRAKARAMRDAVNLGRAVDETEGEDSPRTEARGKLNPPRKVTQGQIEEITNLVQDEALGGADGLKKFEAYIEKPVGELTSHEAQLHIKRLTRQKQDAHNAQHEQETPGPTKYTREDDPDTVEEAIKPESRA